MEIISKVVEILFYQVSSTSGRTLKIESKIDALIEMQCKTLAELSGKDENDLIRQTHKLSDEILSEKSSFHKNKIDQYLKSLNITKK